MAETQAPTPVAEERSAPVTESAPVPVPEPQPAVAEKQSEQAAIGETAKKAEPAAESPAKPAAAKPAKKKKGKQAVRRRRYNIHAALRWVIRIGFFILAPSLFSAAFDGAKTIFTNIGTGNPVELSAFIKLLVVLLLFTVVFGRFFCGYACAFGTLGDVMFVIGKPFRAWLKLSDKPLSPKVQRAFQKIKYVILVVILALCYFGLWSNYSDTSPWSAFASLLAGQPGGMHMEGFVALCILLVGMMLVERFFCQFFCPLGALFSLMPVLPFSSYRRNPERCARSCDKCQGACPVAMHPDPDDVFSGECISCSRCADVCPTCNVNAVRIGPIGKKGEDRRRKPTPDGFVAACKAGMLKIRGSGVLWTCVKACLLLGLCWYLGVVEYLPSFDWVVSVLPTNADELAAFGPKVAAKLAEWGPAAVQSLIQSGIDWVSYWGHRILGWLGMA